MLHDTHALRARIISISSVTSLAGNRGQVNYAAGKGALNAATKALSLEVAAACRSMRWRRASFADGRGG